MAKVLTEADQIRFLEEENAQKDRQLEVEQHRSAELAGYRQTAEAYREELQTTKAKLDETTLLLTAASQDLKDLQAFKRNVLDNGEASKAQKQAIKELIAAAQKLAKLG